MLPGISPNGSNFLNPNGVSPMGEFDIAQFVSAISSQMPRVQDASPQAASSNTGPSPQTGETNGGHVKVHSGDKGKIVKVSWFRPHGITAIAPGESSLPGSMIKVTKMKADRAQDSSSTHSKSESRHLKRHGGEILIIYLRLLDSRWKRSSDRMGSHRYTS